MTELRAYLGDIGIPATSAEALRNQATHWAGACAFEKDAVGRVHCSCGNCGGYRLFLAALVHAYVIGYADMCAESAIADQSATPAPLTETTLVAAAEGLWVVLASVSGGDWTQQSQEWQEAAARWRDNYFAAVTPHESGGHGDE